MSKKRKGSRLITVNGTAYSWFRGKSNTEVKNLETGKAMVVPNQELEMLVEYVSRCDCCFEPRYDSQGEIISYEVGVATPRLIETFIKARSL